MLGVADRSKILELLKFIFDGDQKQSIESLKQMIDEGLDAASLKNDILELLYFILQKKNLGDFESDLTISESELEMIDVISKDVRTETLILFWQFTLKALDEDKILTNPLLGLEMLVIRLLHLKGMPTYEDLINKSISSQTNDISTQEKVIKKILNKESEITQISKNQIKNTTQTKPELSLNPKDVDDKNIKSFEDLIKLASEKKEIHLKHDLENNVNLIQFSERKIDISFNENLDKNFVRNLSEKLLEWTGKRWVITLSKEKGQRTFSELKNIKKKELLNQEKEGEIYKKFKNIFSDGELVKVLKKD
jgi:DNA polymerase-3 subunit gamma/tau